MKLKICGMKYSENIREVAKLQPDLMGFIFYEGSKRFVGNDFIMPEINPAIKKVGVFVLGVGYFNNPAVNGVDIVMREVEKHKLDYAQLHGDEVPEFCTQLARHVKIIKAFGVYDEFDFSVLERYKSCCDYFLFDKKTLQHGGSGEKFNWELLKKYKGTKQFFLSGGIRPEDIPLLKHQYGDLFALDVNSGFEKEPGLKDIDKLKELKHELYGR